MAKHPTPDPAAAGLDEVAKKVNDPGGAHTKGYSADPEPGLPVPEDGPIPLAPDNGGKVLQPKRDEPK
jgi:hypothetical protein